MGNKEKREGYSYFIAYKHREGYGHMQVNLPTKIKSLLDIQEIQRHIIDEMKDNGVVTEDVLILNFQLFD